MSLSPARISGVSEGESDIPTHHGENFASRYRGRSLENPEQVQDAVARLQHALEDGCGVELPQTVIISHDPEAIDFLSDKAVWLTREPERQTRIVDVANDTGLRLSELHARGWAP